MCHFLLVIASAGVSSSLGDSAGVLFSLGDSECRCVTFSWNHGPWQLSLHRMGVLVWMVWLLEGLISLMLGARHTKLQHSFLPLGGTTIGHHGVDNEAIHSEVDRHCL